MNWGKGLTIFITCFILFIGALVYSSFQVKVPLVADDYYEQEINYQQKIDARTALNKLGEVEIFQNGPSADFKLPIEGESNVEITWICFNDTEQDFTSSTTSLSDGTFKVDISKQLAGHYDLKINITQGDNYYYTNKRFIIQ